jgi:hypothetical protein
MFLLPFWEAAMKTLQILLGVGVFVALLGFNFATADTVNKSAKSPLSFSLDLGDGSGGMPDISFDTVGGTGGTESQTTCAMTPGGTSTDLFTEEPINPLGGTPDRLTGYSPQRMFSPIASLNPPPPYYPGMYYPLPPPPPPPPPPVPEPATLMLVGIGVGLATMFARHRRKDQS